MLTGIHPLLTGRLLHHLDAMGHSDSVVIADAHFPAARLGAQNTGAPNAGAPAGNTGTPAVLDFPGTTSPDVLAAICTVLPLDDAPALELMKAASGDVLPVQQELMAAARVDDEKVRFTDRFDFYALAADATVIVRTGETRSYGNALFRKGLVVTATTTGNAAGTAEGANL